MYNVQLVFLVYFLTQVQILTESTILSSFAMNNSNLKCKKVHFNDRTIIFNSLSNRSLKAEKIIQSDTLKNFEKVNKFLSTRNIYENNLFKSNKCKCLEKGKNLKLVVVVLSNPLNFGARMSIRQTWGQFGQRNDIAFFFMLDIHRKIFVRYRVSKEQKLYDDIIQRKSLEFNTNLSVKSVSVLEWVGQYCSKAKFLLKVNDNGFVNMPQLMIFIKTHMNYNNTIFARFSPNIPFYYWSKSDEFNRLHPPDKLSLLSVLVGHMYLLTNDTINKLLHKALEKKRNQVSDITLTTTITEDLKINFINIDEFFCSRKKIDSCSLYKCIGLQDVKCNQQHYLWDKLFACDFHCPQYHCYKSRAVLLLPNSTILFILFISHLIMNIRQRYMFLY